MFVTVPKGEGVAEDFIEYIGITAFPKLALIRMVEDDIKKYVMDSDITTDNISKLLSDYDSGSLAPHVKSQDVPTDNSAPVKVVVGTTFDEYINDTDKHLIIEIFAPWCGHCRKFAPKYLKFAESVAHMDNLVVAKVDGANNDISYQFESFPTVLYYPPGQGSTPVVYESKLTFKKLTRFVKKQMREAWVDLPVVETADL